MLYGLDSDYFVWDYMLDYPAECIDNRGIKYLMGVFDEIANSLGANIPAKAILVFRELLKAMELRNPVSENRNDDLKTLAASVNPVRLKNNPIYLKTNAIYSLYEKIVL